MKIRQAFVRKSHEVAIENTELDHDHPLAGEALLQTEATFISAGTELSIYSGVDPKVSQKGSWCEYPFRPGYANVAKVLEVGPDVNDVAPGDRVFTFSRHQSHLLFDSFGKSMVAKVPKEIDSQTAAAARMAGVAITALQVADLSLNDWVVVFGLGTVGNLAAQFFTLSGARVIGVDPAPARRKLAEEMGIAHTVGGTSDEADAQIRKIIGGKARITVDAVGHSAVLFQAAKVTARFGQLISLGTPRAPVNMNATDLLEMLHYDNITLSGALEWRIPALPGNGVRHSSQQNVELIYDLIARDKLKIRPFISHRLAPEQIKQGYHGLLNKKDEYFGVVLDWTK